MKAIDELSYKRHINLKQHPITDEDLITLVGMFGLKMSTMQITEAKLVGSGG